MEVSDTTDTDRTAPPSPTLSAPRDAAVVNGDEVTFVWRPVDTADAYYVQVANDAKFTDVVFEQEVGDKTALTVAGLFPTNERTFFWRVLAGNEAGWSRGERVQSFVSATPDEVAEQFVAPDSKEQLGPVTELVRSTSSEVSARITSSEDRFEKERDMGVAYEGIPVGQILAISGSILVVIAVISIFLFYWTSIRGQAMRDASVNPSGYTELQETEIEAARELNQYDVIDEQDGVYRIPIDRAMDIMANEAYQQQAGDISPAAPMEPGDVRDTTAQTASGGAASGASAPGVQDAPER
jgi:hypothetical protein